MSPQDAASQPPDATPTVTGCRDGLEGTFCQLCSARADSSRVYYSAATITEAAVCKECGDSALYNILIAVGILLGTACAVGVLVALYRHLPATWRANLSAVWHKFSPDIKLKIIVAFFLIATQINDVYESEMPPDVKRLLSTFSVAVSIGFDGIGSVLECLELRGYRAKLAAHMGMPPVVCAIIVMIGACRTRDCSAAALLERTAPYVLRLLFLAYPLVTKVAFEAFQCHDFDDGSWLKADVSIQCDSDDHGTAKALASVAIGLYPIGQLLVNGALLLASRHAIIHDSPTVLSRSIDFLHHAYKPHLFWWELVDMSRSFVFVGVMILFQGDITQLLVAALLSVAFVLLQAMVEPYKQTTNSFLASASSFCLAILFLCSVAFKFAALSNLPDIRERMSDELKRTYPVQGQLFTYIAIGATIGTIVVAGVILVVILKDESRQERKLFNKIYRDSTTGLLNKRRFTEDCAELKKRGLEDKWGILYWSIDIQGFKAVNDKISHVVGDKALARYGQMLPAVVGKQAATNKDAVAECRVYRTGGDELAVICLKTDAASFKQFCSRVTRMVKEVAKTEYIAQGEYPYEEVQVPTFLRIGVGSSWQLADEAETAVRTSIYMSIFGSLDARGQSASRAELHEKGLINWDILLAPHAEVSAARLRARSSSGVSTSSAVDVTTTSNTATEVRVTLEAVDDTEQELEDKVAEEMAAGTGIELNSVYGSAS